MRIPKLNLDRSQYDVVAANVLESMRGEQGAFHVYVSSEGLVRVLNKLHRKIPAANDHRRTYGEIIGTYTASTPLEYIEDDILEAKRRRSVKHGRNQ